MAKANDAAPATETKTTLSLADPVVIKTAVQESVKAATVKQAEVQAVAAGGTFDEAAKAAAEKKAEVKVAVLETVVTSAVAAVESVNTLLSDKNLDPTDIVATSVIKVAQQTVQTQVAATAKEVFRVVETALATASVDAAVEDLVKAASDAVAADTTAAEAVTQAQTNLAVAEVVKDVQEQVQDEVDAANEGLDPEDQISVGDLVDNTDSDGDTIPDRLDPDDDNDGLNDSREASLGH